MDTPGRIIALHFGLDTYPVSVEQRSCETGYVDATHMDARAWPRGAGPLDGNEDTRAVVVTVTPRHDASPFAVGDHPDEGC